MCQSQASLLASLVGIGRALCLVYGGVGNVRYTMSGQPFNVILGGIRNHLKYGGRFPITY